VSRYPAITSVEGKLTGGAAFFLTAHFSEEDYPYDWLMLWLSRRPEWQRSREFETTTRTAVAGPGSRTADNSFGDEDDEGDVAAAATDDTPGKVKTRVVFQPTFDSTHTIYYRGHWLRVKRSRNASNCEVLSIRCAHKLIIH
jgi:chaperone BCS1